MALKGLFCADMPLRNYSLTHLSVGKVQLPAPPTFQTYDFAASLTGIIGVPDDVERSRPVEPRRRQRVFYQIDIVPRLGQCLPPAER